MWPALLTCNIEKKNFKAQKITTTLSPRGMEELLREWPSVLFRKMPCLYV